MPNVIFPENFASVLADLQSRLLRLECNRPGIGRPSLTLLVSASPANVNLLAYSATFKHYQGGANTTFTTTDVSTEILCFASDTFWSQGGTANYAMIQIGIYDAATGLVQYAVSGQAVHTNNVTGNPVSNGGLHCHASLPPGTYALYMDYLMQGGATTTFSNLDAKIDVYQIVSLPN